MTAILNEEPPSLSQISASTPPGLQRVVHRCLEKDPEHRFHSAHDLAFALEALSESASGIAQTIQRSSSNKLWRIVAVVAGCVLVLGAVSAYFYRRAAHFSQTGFDLQKATLTRLTDSGKVRVAALSPDGRYVAYSLQDSPYSLYVRQVSPESTIQVIPSTPDALKGISFSPDGNYLYFVRHDAGYVVPTLGGTPKRIIEVTFGGIGVSPDGRRLAFTHGGDSPVAQLIVANPDGSSQRVIAEHPQSSGIGFWTAAAPSWSPDGRLIAMIAAKDGKYLLNVYPSEGGAPKSIQLPGWSNEALWLPDQSGILVTISSGYKTPKQIWLQPFPQGNLLRVTNDLDGYGYLSISRDGKTLATVQVQDSYTIFIAPSSKPDQGTAIRSGKSDGTGLAWLPDGRILSQSVESEFSLLSSDGKQKTPLFKHEVLPGRFSVCKDGHIFLERGRIWQSDNSGQNLKQITEGPNDSDPDCSPDSLSVIYTSKGQLMKLPISGGTAAILAKTSNGCCPRFSPDGRKIAVYEADDRHDWLSIRNAETGQVEKTFDVPEDVSTPWGSNGLLRWTPDGRMLTYLFWRGFNTPANIWSQSLSGGPLRQITHFPDGIIAYDWSPDGKQLVYTRSAPTRDVVLISNFH